MATADKNNDSGHLNHWIAEATKSGTYEFATGGKYVDRNIDFKIPQASETVSGTASVDASVTVPVSVGTKTAEGKYPFSGSQTISKSITGTATATVGTKGFTDSNSYSGSVSGTTTGSAGVSGTMDAANVVITSSATVKPNTATIGEDNVSTGTVSTSAPTDSGVYYITVNSSTPASTVINQNKTSSTTGYLGDIASEISASGAVTGGTTTTYIPITKATIGSSNTGAAAGTIAAGSSEKYINITEGYTPARKWTIGAVTKSAGIAAVGGTKTPAVSATDPGAGYTANTTAAISSGGWLKLDAGYYDATKISLATLIGDDIDDITTTTAANYMLSGHRAYDKDGNVLLGNITDNSSTFTGGTISTQGGKVTVPAGYLSSAVDVTASLPTMTLPTAANTTAGSETNKGTVSRSTSAQYIHIPSGYNDTAVKYTISATPNVGTATTVPTAVDTTVTVGTTATSGYYDVTNTVGAKVTYASAGWVAATGSTGSASVKVGKIAQSTSKVGTTDIASGSKLGFGNTLTIGAGYYPTARTFEVPSSSDISTTTASSALNLGTAPTGYTNPVLDTTKAGGKTYIELKGEVTGYTLNNMLTSVTTPTTKYMEVYTGTYSVS